MHRRVLMTVVFVVLMFCSARPAEAGFWAWLEEWSGPGPFKGFTFLFTACVQDEVIKASPIAMNDGFHRDLLERAQKLQPQFTAALALDARRILKRFLANPALVSEARLNEALARTTPPPAAFPLVREESLVRLYSLEETEHGPGHAHKTPLCGYIDQGFFEAAPNRGFPRITAHLTDLGPSARLHDGIDVGAGFGFVRFSGDISPKRQFTLTPVRLIVRPLLLAVPDHYRKKWMGLLNIYWKETYVVGRLTGADFGAPESGFQVNGELIRSFGLNLDITALFGRDW